MLSFLAAGVAEVLHLLKIFVFDLVLFMENIVICNEVIFVIGTI